MRGRHLLCASLVLAPSLALGAAACQHLGASEIALDMLAPAGVLDEASAVTLFVFPAEGRTCNADGGVSELPADAPTFSLSRTGCEGGAVWCTELSLERDDSERKLATEMSGPAAPPSHACAFA